MLYAEYDNSNDDEISNKLKQQYNDNSKNIVNNDNNVPVFNNYYNQNAGYCNMSFGGLIKQSKTSTIVVPINADLEYDADCKMGYNTTLLIPLTVPEITSTTPLVIVPVVTQQKIDNENKNIINTTTQQPIFEAKVVDNKIVVKPIENIADIKNNTKIVTAVTNLNETPLKTEATTVVSLAVQPDENKKVVTDSSVINTDTSGSNVKTNTNLTISQTCLNGTLQCDVEQKIQSVKTENKDNYVAYLQSTRTIVDLSSGEISLYGKNETHNIKTIPTNFIDLSANHEIVNDPSENTINLANENNSLKVQIPVNAPTVIKVDINGEIINTTSEPIKINTIENIKMETIIERFNLNNIEGYNVTPVFHNFATGTKENLPNVNIPVFTNVV